MKEALNQIRIRTRFLAEGMTDDITTKMALERLADMLEEVIEGLPRFAVVNDRDITFAYFYDKIGRERFFKLINGEKIEHPICRGKDYP